MALNVTSQPDELSLLGNLKPFIFNTDAEFKFRLSYRFRFTGETGELLVETYMPDADGNITIDVKDVIGQLLSLDFPYTSSRSIRQEHAIVEVNAESLSDDADELMYSYDFTVLLGGAALGDMTSLDWLMANFLTGQPQSKIVRLDQPELLTYYYTVVNTKLVARLSALDGTEEIVSLANSGTSALRVPSTRLFTFSEVYAMSAHPLSELQRFVDIWVELVTGERLSYIQRYVVAPADRNEHYYFAVNSFGGIDSFCFTGAKTLSPSVSYESAMLSGKMVDITQEHRRKWSQSSGKVGSREAEWLWQFFSSSKHWAFIDGEVREIVLESTNIAFSSADNLHLATFSFSLAQETPTSLPRISAELPAITMSSPADDLL